MHDADLFLVVGYQDHYSMTDKQLNIYGAYTSLKKAADRIETITHSKYKKEINVTWGSYYCLWVNKIQFGDLNVPPNSGAYTSDFSMYSL